MILEIGNDFNWQRNLSQISLLFSTSCNSPISKDNSNNSNSDKVSKGVTEMSINSFSMCKKGNNCGDIFQEVGKYEIHLIDLIEFIS